ncbi:hypothetical protein [uncultured Bacteroides sp.]|uniref:hypothetical protein n=1 Tax=uncultured Bacteroides sp. TaxID=162156 RepID=UPI0025A97AD7|nr:hypothetical protein [uncultured Bacteroides sp.]
MKIVTEIIRQQSVLKEWFEHANRQYKIYKNNDKEGFKREFDILIEDGNKLAQMSKIDSLELLCDITDGSPQNECLSATLEKNWLIRLKEGEINHKLRFFNSLLEDKIISFKEYSEAYHLAHVLNWNMESNALVGEQALKDAGYYNNLQQDKPKVDGQQFSNKPPQYSKELVGLFHGHRGLIDELVGKSDNEIAVLIKEWAKGKDNLGKPLIENPSNRMQTAFAKELKQNGLIKLSEESFRKKL